MIEFSVLAFLALYAAFIIYLIACSITYPRPLSSGAVSGYEAISVVIPVKNEEHNIPGLLGSLAKQDYGAAVEILFVDDGSDDATVDVINRESGRYSIPVRCICGRFDRQKKLTSKQQAIDLGIQEASFPLIALTDADMSLRPNWLSELVGALQPSIDMVYGHTTILPDGKLFTAFQSFQLEVLFSVAALFHYCGIDGSCMGNNILLRKSAFIACGGYDRIGYCITEDRALLRHFRRNGRKVAIVSPFHPNAVTGPHHSVTQFYRQLVRWARGGFTNGTGLLLFGTIVAVQNSVALLGVIGILSSRCGAASLLIFLLTWLLIAISFYKNRSPVHPIGFPFFYLFLLIEMICILPALLIPVKITWKGNRV